MKPAYIIQRVKLLSSPVNHFLDINVERPVFVAGLLLTISTLAYGLLIPWLHLYIDDLIWVWTWEKFGREGLVRYFATNRPVWGLIFQGTIPLLSNSVIGSHLFALLIRWCSALSCWWLLTLTWPGQKRTALYSALLFLVYPGFVLQPIALTYGHIFLIDTIFLLSLCFNMLALRLPQKFGKYTAVAMFLSLVNLLTLEFFFTLELARPFFIWQVASKEKTGLRNRLFTALIHWLPYLAIFIGAVIWRMFFFKYQTYNHPIILLEQLQGQPFNTLLQLSGTILRDLLTTSLEIWLVMLNRLQQINLRQVNGLFTLLLAIATTGLLFLVLFGRKIREDHSPRQQVFSWQAVGFGLVLLLAAGWPFWITQLEVRPVEFSSRMTIPFILGAVLVITGLLNLIPSNRFRSAVIALAVGLACSYHFQIANDFRLDWFENRKLMWQIAWRIPAMVEGTTLLITDFPVTYYNTAALSTELDGLYSAQSKKPDMGYYMLYSRELDRDLAGGLAQGKPISGGNVTAQFKGTTSQVLAAQYNASRCFRLLDPLIDSTDETLPDHLRKAAELSRPELIKTSEPAANPPSLLFGEEPARQWCYYFQKADLARQAGDWQRSAQMGDQAAAAGLSPRDEMELLVIIEAYAHTNQWEKAIELSNRFEKSEKQPMLCKIWQRIMDDTPESSEKISALQKISEIHTCPLTSITDPGTKDFSNVPTH